jgi:hypothetical protein
MSIKINYNFFVQSFFFVLKGAYAQRKRGYIEIKRGKETPLTSSLTICLTLIRVSSSLSTPLLEVNGFSYMTCYDRMFLHPMYLNSRICYVIYIIL